MAPRLSSLRNLLAGPTPKAWGAEFIAAQQPAMKTLSGENSSISDFLARFNSRGGRQWQPMSVKQAMSVPAIQRAVSLIAGTTGMISVQGFRNGVQMAEPPRLLARPDPNEQPGTFYAGTAANMAKYGEFVWLIGGFSDGLASSLINVPLRELDVEENKRDRIRSRYKWGDIESTRWTPGNPTGRFVHVKYPLAEPFALRGEGPLQLCGAAVNVAVESQEWAANFYAEGGMPGLLIKVAHTLGSIENIDDPDDEEAAAISEAAALLRQWTDRANNSVRVIDPNIEDVKYLEPNPQGAQMLDSRNWSNGDAARMYGIPGSLLEYATPGSSLTYQNVGQEMDKLTRICLQPFYFEPIEQALSDLLPRTQAARFNVKGFLRADAKTRFEIHKLAIDSEIYDAEHAQREEGLLPGDPEYAPVLFSPPAASSPIPVQLSRPHLVGGPWRCDGCGRKLAEERGVGTKVRCRCGLAAVA